MAKKIVIAVVAIIVIAAGGLYILYSNLGSILKAAIEKYGSEATQAQVKVDSVTLSASSGQGTIKGLVIGNPSGFNTPYALNLGSVSLTLDVGTVTQNPVVVKEVVISAPKVMYERGASSGNLEKIQENVQKYAASFGSGQAPSAGASKPAAGGDKAERKVVIEQLYVRDGEVAISATQLQGRSLSAGLPTIHLQNIGKDKGGATPAEVAQRVVGAITQEAAKVGAAGLQKALSGAVQEQLKKLPTDAGGLKGLLGGGK